MRLRSLGLTFVLAALALVFVAGCSGGGGGTPPTPVTVTTTTLTPGTVHSTFTATLAATGGSGTYTWWSRAETCRRADFEQRRRNYGHAHRSWTQQLYGSGRRFREDSGIGTQALKLAISGGTLTITSLPLQDGQVGHPLSQLPSGGEGRISCLTPLL